MDDFQNKSIITKPHSLTYSYYTSPGFQEKLNPAVPTLLFVHGFPDHALMWEGAIAKLKDLPYPMLAVDLLGMGNSSKPADAVLYNYKKQADAIAQILDHEGVPNNVIPIGHDWGSATSQRFYLYHKKRCVGLSLISLAYQVPSEEPFDLDTVNDATSKRFGYPQWEYWKFFTAPDAANLLRENLERFWEINNGNYPSPKPEENGRDIWMREMFCTPNAFRDYINQTGPYQNKIVQSKPYPDLEKVRASFIKRLSRDGLEGPVNYYHSLKNNTMLEDERTLCNTPNDQARKIEVPLLYIGQTGDWVCRTDLMSDTKDQGLVADLEEKVVDSGHWVLYEKPEEIASLLRDWLSRKFPVKK
ncbi:hypothetical protein AMS68_007876 [Peltaster fructicola]|uniref:AB hydrolase-1 domain-containing protein n=1 Tax=Peltaster fructicola TaxID=286661 RepID=A0A6H0Y698_9PEZI|nr:hypothetical protein AMS68_007876 [Peltaster fructicola]